MEMKVTFPGGKRVQAAWDEFTVMTDQPPVAGGEGAAPTPFDYFLASLATCAGIYVLSFCQQRQIATDGLALSQQVAFAEDGDGRRRLAKVSMVIDLPPGFPEKYRGAIVRTAELCTVKKVLQNPPEFVIDTRMA